MVVDVFVQAFAQEIVKYAGQRAAQKSIEWIKEYIAQNGYKQGIYFVTLINEAEGINQTIPVEGGQYSQ